MADETPGQPTVVVEGGAIDGHSMPLSEGTTLIVGSGRLAHLRLDHPAIELAHVKIAWDALGIAMTDNGSRHGTWVNGEMVESAALLDGDVITFAPPGTQPPPPQVRMRIPKGSVPEPPPLPPEAEAPPPMEEARPAPAPPRPTAPPRRARRRRSALALPSPRTLGLAAGGLIVIVVLAGVAARLLGPTSAPRLSSIQPARCEAGCSIAVAGSGFEPEAVQNTVWFDDRSVPAATVGGDTLHVSVPASVSPGRVSLVVETSGGRSNAVTFEVLATLTAAALDPPGALPGDPVVLRGQSLDAGEATVTVGGAPARVLEVTPDAVRFEMPAVEGARGSTHAVVATVGERSTSPLEIALGRLPLVISFDPPRARTGEIVHVRGVGFPGEAEAATVTFDGVRALVVASSPRELAVVAPLPVGAAPETAAEVRVRVGERVSSDGARYPLVRLTTGTYVLRFFAAAGEGVGTATVATEVAPVLLLSGKGAYSSVATRAMRVAAALNDLLDRPRGGPLVFEAQERPEVGVGAKGSPGVLVRVSAADAAAYAAPPGRPARGAPPVPAALARWWAALLNDYVAVCTGPDRPSSVASLSPEGGDVLTELRQALPWRYRAGVANEQVAALPERLRARLLSAALDVP